MVVEKVFAFLSLVVMTQGSAMAQVGSCMVCVIIKLLY